MATTLTLYNQASELLTNGLVDLDADTIKLALVTSAYTFDAEHDEFADASAAELADASYTAGGAALAGKALTRTGAQTKFDANDVTFASLAGTFRMGILYAVGSFGALTNPLIAMVLFDDTPADIALSGVNFSVLWNSSGILTVG
jgi:hypothetical protein